MEKDLTASHSVDTGSASPILTVECKGPSKMAFVRELTDDPEDLRRHLADIIKTVRN